MTVDGDNILTDPVSRVVYATDNSIYQVAPHGVLLATDADQVARFLAENHRSDTPRPIVARGAGTGTNGQSLTDGVVIEVKRRLNRLLALDVDNRTAVVQPGMVTAELNAELQPHGLFWAPHTSTLNRATVGGMISTDAAGKGSLVHGRAHRHVLAVDVVLDDGTPFRAEPTPVPEAERLAAAGGRIGRLWRDLLDLPLVEDGEYGLPELARGFSGYGIDRVRRDGMIDPVPLLCGAEGTLAVITSATIALTPIPANTVLIVAGYRSFADALDDAVELAVTRPTAIESFDETTLARGRSSPAWPALGQLVGDREGSVLLLEYSGDVEPDVRAIAAALAATGRSYGHRVVTDAAEQAEAWKVRADAVGLLAKVATGGPELSARPTAMVEDCAVPVANMPSFIAGFRSVLDGFGLEYGMFGHADVGCVHVRPALDITDPGHEALVRQVTDRVVELVAEHGGILWGEHGRGFRGDVVDSFLPPETVTIMRAVKRAFDPDDLLNPGKLYRPLGSPEPIVALDDAPLRGTVNRRVSLEVRQEFSDAFACNGNGLCHHYGGSEVMCPSYKVTGDPALSPKGRADLIRAWLAGGIGGVAGPGDAPAGADSSSPAERGHFHGPDGGALADALAENLDQCLSCSACSGRCPVEVDIPELKSQFFDRYYRNRRRPLSHLVLSRFETLAGLSRFAPGPLAGLAARAAGPLLGLVDLPTPDRPSRAVAPDVPTFHPDLAVDLVILPDVFTATLEPGTLATAVEVLRRVGYTVAVSRFVPSGKFDHVKGRRSAFRAAGLAQADLIAEVFDAGATPVVIEPAVALLHRHEYPAIVTGYPVGVRYLAEILHDRLDRIAPVASPRAVTLLGHCTERATGPGWLPAWGDVLRAAGHTVTAPTVGCCGMAGIFGHERGNQELSRALFDLTWSEPVAAGRENPDRVVAATGYSCRSQTKRLVGDRLQHPVHLL
ncbi:MAG: FAD-binding and (Fe-S)-binding domain-containing protein [Actinomycetota bacterium]